MNSDGVPRNFERSMYYIIILVGLIDYSNIYKSLQSTTADRCLEMEHQYLFIANIILLPKTRLMGKLVFVVPSSTHQLANIIQKEMFCK